MSSYPAPGPTYPQYTRGICYDGTGYIYGNNYSRDYVNRFRASDGSLLSTWTYAKADTRYGLCVDHNGTSAGNYIYQSDLDGDFWKSTLTGTLVSSWSMHTYNYVYDQAWDYNNKLIWCADYSTDWINAIDPNTHKMTYSFRHPKWATILNCYGIAYWGDYLYVSNSGGTPDEYIWVFHCPHYLGVKPASLGKVKALLK